MMAAAIIMGVGAPSGKGIASLDRHVFVVGCGRGELDALAQMIAADDDKVRACLVDQRMGNR